ncbi:MAG: L-lactate dehydrogenase complex protein LldG [Clostridia bacterium]|jgi:L-lactate dehydrogenase complex protein LldG|nr:L-lactate dehydrogenase complex protein LldG [Clostridia bacterium]MDN5321823.1 L-lactate dehydrogenase complex protein LldG [Clostridia bacterium]
MSAQAAQIVDWKAHLPQGAGAEELYKSFKEKAEALTVKVIRASSKEEAEKAIVAEMKELKIKKAVGVPMTLVDVQAIKEALEREKIKFSLELDRDFIEQAEFGISEFDLGIAELGTIVQDANSVHKRLVSMLPPTHLAVISTKTIVETFADSLEVIEKVYNGNPSNFLAFVTGPSKTADIERVLTIGVHGPGRLIVVCVD